MAFNNSSIKQKAVKLFFLLTLSIVLQKTTNIDPKALKKFMALLLLGSNYLAPNDNPMSDTQSNLSLQEIKNSFNHFRQSCVTFFTLPEEEESEVEQLATNALYALALHM